MYGLFQAPRALTVQSAAIAQIAGQPVLVPLKLEGVEGINRLFEYRLTLQTPDALNFTGGQGSNFELDDFIGKEITCFIELEGHGSFVVGVMGSSLGGTPNQGAGVREISALITDARYIGQDNRHALYELTLRPWLHLATLTTDCKVFQDQTPIQVIEAVLADYPFAADKRLIDTYPVRDYCVQYNETDFEFVTRLMQEWGINYHWEHSGGVHRLIWSDHNGAFQVTTEIDGVRVPMGFEMGLPGAHADVGGSYTCDFNRPVEEKRDLPPTRLELRSAGRGETKQVTRPGPQAFAYAQGWYTPEHRISADWHVRQVTGDYCKVGLSTMVMLAKKYTGVNYPQKLSATALQPEVQQMQAQVHALVNENAFVPGKPTRVDWSLDKEYSEERAKAFRKQFLHVSFRHEDMGYEARFKDDTALGRYEAQG